MLDKAIKKLDGLYGEMIAVTQKALTFNTVDAPKDGDAPFGKETRDCLHYLLDEGEKMGFIPYNCDNYAGHLDYGEGEEVLGILGHVDVVPVTAEGWIAPPFAGEIVNDTLYGRGAVDDKGPLIACLYAMKALKDAGHKPRRKIRLIIGCNEETGMECMTYYKTKVKAPDIAFSPDGNFPCVNVEKNIYGMTIDCGALPAGISEISAGTARNVVPNSCTAKIKGELSEETKKALTAIGVSVSYRCKVTTLTSKGVSAHASLPWEGENATRAMFSALKIIFPEDELIKHMAEKVSADYYGKAWGVALSDAVSGKLTSSLNMIWTEKGRLIIGVDFRFPVSYTHTHLEELVVKCSPFFKILPDGHKSPSVYVPADSELVTKCLAAYSRQTGRPSEAIAIGGGTYSKMLPNCVAFGPEVYGEKGTLHQTNECIEIERFKELARIYLDAIYELSK